MIERGTVPAWLEGQIRARKDEIAATLRSGGEIVLHGPNGECINIRERVAA
jgi:hypothetical protein